MRVDYNQEALGKKNVMIATPMHRGVCHGAYTSSLVRLVCIFQQLGIEFTYLPCEGDALVPRARNRIATQFLNSKCTHLLFLDGDIEFMSGDIIVMLSHECEIICAAYPLKRLNWEKVVKAAEAVTTITAKEMEQVACSDFVVNYLDKDFDINRVCRVAEMGTGCMLIARSVFEDMIRCIGGQLGCKPMVDDPSYEGYIWSFFDCGRDEDGYYQPEDYMFCQRWRKLGGSIWLCPWIKLTHVGEMKFTGNIKYAFLEGGKFNVKKVA
jgi:hypothetical protein